MMDPSDAASLMLQAEKALPGPIRPELVAYCPTMDMIAVVTDEDNLDVYRLNGQRAFTRKRKNDDLNIESIVWKYNGKKLAVAWSDGTIDMISTETGKVNPQTSNTSPDDPKESSATRISCMAWASNFINLKAVKSKLDTESKRFDKTNEASETTDNWSAAGSKISFSDVLQGHLDLQVLDPAPDLPDQIALSDSERLLPKLSAVSVPSLGPFARSTRLYSEVLMNQTSVDDIFHSNHLEYANAVENLLLCHADGVVSSHNSRYGSAGRENAMWTADTKSSIVHASHPYSRSHCLLMSVFLKQSSSPKVCVAPLTFRYLASAGMQVHLLGAKRRQLEHVLAYIQECIRLISEHWYHSQELPSRFMRNINETLAEKGEGDLVQNLYHLAVTGHCAPPVKEWLIDELTESGHKRWDHAVMQGVSKVIEMIHENLIPAIDRCSIIVSLFRGFARYDDAGAVCNVPALDLTNILESLKCLRLLSYRTLDLAREEKSQFIAFSRWLRDEIDVQATDPTTASPDEAADRDLGVDFSHVLEFIRGPLCASALNHFLHRKPSPKPDPKPPSSFPTYEEIARGIDQIKSQQQIDDDLVDTWSSYMRLHVQCHHAFEQIARWHSSNTTMNVGLVLEDESISAARDIKMVREADSPPDTLTTFVALIAADQPNQIRLHRVNHQEIFDHITSDNTAHQVLNIKLPPGTVRDIKFVDNDFVMALFRTNESSCLLSIPYSPGTSSNSAAHWSQNTPDITSLLCPNGHAVPVRPVWDLSNANSLKPFVKHVFPSNERFVPLKLEVNGRKHRRVACVVDEDLKHYKVFDLDYAEGEERDESRIEGVGDEEMSSDVEMDG